METIELDVHKREVTTKGSLRSQRVQGEIPAVLYGGKKSSISISVNHKKFLQIMKGHGMNVLIHLKVGADTETVLVKDIQRHVLNHDIIHIDFQRISMTEKIEVNVPLHIKGEAPGVKMSGGILEHILRELRVRCLPSDIPETLDIDVSALEIGQGIKVQDLALPKGVEALIELDHLVVNVVSPSELKEPEPATDEGAAPAEPEVIAKGKKPEEEEAKK